MGAGEGDFTSLSGDYSVFLPSLDFRIDFTDDWVGRVSYSETITRPNYGDIQGGQTIDSPVRVESGTGNRGNPALLPFESANLDFSFEYYYAADSYLAIGYYRKAVENFIGTSRVTETTFDLPHPALGPLGDAARTATGSTEAQVLYEWILENRADEPGVDAARGVISGVAGRDPSAPFNLTVPVNIEQATMSGWELVVQHSFGDSGFGAIVNATFADADVEYDNFSLAQQFVLTGLSDSANVIAFYDKNGVSVRLAYNWRDSFLAGTGQANVGAGPPSYVAAYQQLDLSASYWVTDAIQVYVDALNITDQTTLVHGPQRAADVVRGAAGRPLQLGLALQLLNWRRSAWARSPRLWQTCLVLVGESRRSRWGAQHGERSARFHRGGGWVPAAAPSAWRAQPAPGCGENRPRSLAEGGNGCPSRAANHRTRAQVAADHRAAAGALGRRRHVADHATGGAGDRA